MGRLFKSWQTARFSYAAVIACALPGSLYAGTIRHDTSDSQYLSLASNPAYASVGMINTNDSQASGVLIGSRWVLTAGHVVSFQSPTTVTFNVNGVDYTASEWYEHPDWLDSLGFGTDVGLVRLSAPVVGVAPAVRYTGTSELGAVGTIVGYGLSGTGLTGEQLNTYGTKRAGQNVLDALGSAANNSDNYLMADFDQTSIVSKNSFGSGTPLTLEYSSAQGDSGGGVFINDGGVQKLAGIVSFGQQGPINNPSLSPNFAAYGDLMGFTRVSTLNAWIDEQLTSRFWTNSSSGTFSSGANWDGGAAAGAGNIAVLSASGTYTISTTSNVTNKRLRLRAGDVTLNLQGHTYSLTGSGSMEAALQVHRPVHSSFTRLTVSNGTLSAPSVEVNSQLVIASGATLMTSGAVEVGRWNPSSGFGWMIVEDGATATIGGLKTYGVGHVEFKNPISLPTLEMSGGEIVAEVPMTITNAGTLHSGKIMTSGTQTELIIPSSAALHLPTRGDTWIDSTIENSGSIFISTPIPGEDHPVSGYLKAPMLNNHPGAVVTADFTHDSTIQMGLTNEGTFIKTGPGTLRISSRPVTNTGTILLQQGTLMLNYQTQLGGTLLTSPGATLHFGYWGDINVPDPSILPTSNVVLSGTLNLNGNNSFTGLTWNGGTLTGPGKTTIAADGSATISKFYGEPRLMNRNLDNAGTVLVNGLFIALGTSSFSNLPGATLNMNNGTLEALDNTIVSNSGVINSRNLSQIQATLTNTGTINVESGTLSLVNRTINSSGRFNLAPGACLVVSAGLMVSNPADFPTSGVILAGGAMEFAGDNTFTELPWNTGSIAGPGTTRIPAGGVVTMSGLSRTLNGRTLENAGSIVIPTGTFTGVGSAILYNLPGGAIDIRSPYWGMLSGSGLLKNQGLLKLTVGGIFDINWPIEQAGTISVEQGLLSLNAGGTHNGGTYSAGPWGTLAFGGGTHYIQTPASLASAPYRLSGATLHFNGDNIYGNLDWSHGTITGSGKTIIPAGQTATFNFVTDFDRQPWLTGRVLENSGTLVAAGRFPLRGDSQSGLNNLAGGAFKLDPLDDDWTYWQVLGYINGPVAPFNNAGLLTKVSGPNRAEIRWSTNNTGTVEVQSGSLVFMGPVLQHSGTLLAGGAWNVIGASTLSFENGSGSITTFGPAAAVRLDGPNARFDKINTLSGNQGTFTITNGRRFTTTGSFTNSGQIDVGPASTLKITSSLTNTGSIDLGYFDSALIIDYASIAPTGSIAAQLLSGYNTGLWNGPGINSSFAALDPALMIGYASNQRLGLANFGGLNVDATSLLLKVTLGGDANFDEVVDLKDLTLLATHWQASSDWMGGDFDYNGMVNAVDLGILARNWTDHLADVVQSVAALGLPETAVPEPGSIACFGVALMAFRRRRRVATASLPR